MQRLREAAGDEYRTFGIPPDFSSLNGVQEISVVGPLAPAEYATFIDLTSAPGVANFFRGSSTFGLTTRSDTVYTLDAYLRAKPILDWVGVRYLVLDRAFFRPGARTDDHVLSQPEAGVHLVYEDTTVRIFESPNARPKAEFWDSAQVYRSVSAIVSDLQAHPEWALGPPKLERGTAPPFPAEGSGVPSPVTVDDYTPNEVRLSVAAPSSGLVVLKDAYFPGWQAWVDGQPAPVIRVDGIVRGVPVSGAGVHTMVVEYRPASFVRGAWLAAAVGLLLLLTLTHAGYQRLSRVATS
jgi:hypothetical protein